MLKSGVALVYIDWKHKLKGWINSMSLATEHTFEKKGNMGVLQVIKLLVLPSDSRFVREEFLKNFTRND